MDYRGKEDAIIQCTIKKKSEKETEEEKEDWYKRNAKKYRVQILVQRKSESGVKGKAIHYKGRTRLEKSRGEGAVDSKARNEQYKKKAVWKNEEKEEDEMNEREERQEVYRRK